MQLRAIIGAKTDIKAAAGYGPFQKVVILSDTELTYKNDEPPGMAPASTVLTERELKRVALAIAFIEKHSQDHISPEGLSVEVKLSVCKLQAGVKSLTGCSVSGYQEQMRIKAAKDLLSTTDLSIAIIAKRTGFRTHSHFGVVFKRQTALTPLQYRNQYGC